MNPIETTYYHSPVGWIRLQATASHLCSTKAMAPSSEEEVHEPASPILKEAVCQLKAYFAGERQQFDLPLQQSGTPFQQKVWQELQKIPYGEKISYQELACRVGNPKACRAVGSANGKNNIFILVPCHRVVRSTGQVGGFAYGSEMKEFLLQLEHKK
ncbi:MAG: methylated-DNA--[protein]-cysteine S-methyltransferase [Tannerellaceae bacterium]|nr:methylated-DNA--[protein]-cysteine S-methyltransferase [Tannerellaceae bacterium]